MEAQFLTSFGLLVVAAFFLASATDPSQLEDFCVAPNDPNNAILVQGKLCKNPSEVTADDFFYSGLNLPRETNSPYRDNVFPVDAKVVPGLNTLGISFARVDLAASGGLGRPHSHPRATELVIVIEGTVYGGFVSFNQSDNSARLFSKVLRPGDLFVVPPALLHFFYSVGDTNAVLYVAYNTQNVDFTPVADSLFGAQPPISAGLLSESFQLDPAIVKDLQSKF